MKMSILILFVSALFLGYFVHTDYGLGWDEYVMRELGYMDYNYITKGGNYAPNPFYGSITELPLILLELKLDLVNNMQAIFFMRHLYVHIVFLIGVLSFYFLILKLYKKRYLAIIGFLFYITAPILYGHSFINTKDIPFLSYMSISLLVAYSTFNNINHFKVILLGLVSAALVNARIIGILFVPLSLLFLIILLRGQGIKIISKRVLTIVSFYLLSFILTLYVSWPTLWSDPINKFVGILKMSSNYSYSGSLVLTAGEYVSSFNLPWYYLPLWMGITIPVVVLAFFAIGVFSFSFKYVRKSILAFPAPETAIKYIAFIFIVLTLGAEMIFRMPIFDGWRHMIFLYLFVLIFSIEGLNNLMSQKGILIRYSSTISVIYGIFSSIVFNIRYHPYQHLYFNELVSRNPEHIRKNYELDYWGTSYREGIAYVLAESKKEVTKIAVAHTVGNFNAYLMSLSQRKKFYIVNDVKNGDYFISCFRGHPSDYPLDSLLYAPKVLNSTYMAVWKLTESDKRKTIPTE